MGFLCSGAVFAALSAAFAAAQAPSFDPRPALESIQAKRAEGDFEAARAELRALSAAAGESPAWFAADLQRLEATLEKALAGSDELRAELARAAQLGRDAAAAFAAGDRPRAAAQAAEAVELLARALGEDHPETAWQRNELAWWLGTAQESSAFEREAERVVAAGRALAAQEPHPLLAAGLATLGYARLKLGRIDEARAAFEESRALWDELGDFALHRDKHAFPLAGLAQIEGAFGRWAEADALYAAALALVRADPGERSESYANLLNNIGSAFVQRGAPREAEPFLKLSLALKLELLQPGNPSTANTLHNLAVLYLETGDYAAAEDAVADALARTADAVGADLQIVALTASMAQSNLVRGRCEQAQELAREAVRLGRKVYAEQPESLAALLDTLAQTLLEGEELEEAGRVLDEAQALRAPLGAQAAAADFPMRAIQAFHEGELERAGELAADALEARRAAAPRADTGDAHLLLILARAALAEGELEEAEEQLLEAARIQDRARAGARPGVARATFGGSHAWSLLAGVRAALGDARGAWEAQERWRGRALLDLLADVERAALEPADARRLDELELGVAAAEQRFAAARAGGEEAEAARAREAALALEIEIEALLAAAPGALGASHAPFELERVQAALAEREALVGWLAGESDTGDAGLWAWVLRAEGEPLWTFTRSADAALRAGDLRAALAEAALAAFPPRADADDAAARGLYELLFELLEDDLAGVEALVLVPAAPIAGLPLETLRAADGRTVDERWTVAYAPSASIHAWLRELGPARPGSAAAPALVIGDPPFRESHRAAPEDADHADHADADDPDADDPEDKDSPAPRARSAERPVSPGSLPRLPASRREAQAVAELVPGSTVLLGAAATERALHALDLGSFGVLHFATHALVDDERADRSALVLSQLDLPDPLATALRGERVDDGLLEAGEIARELELKAELVVLSACETALGRPLPSEGYLGLADAFLQAGARSVIASLWSVDDRAAELFMRRFYAAWRNGASKSAALQSARAALREHVEPSGTRPFAHPGTWGAFVLIGDGR